MQEAFADHLRHVGRVYPQEKHTRVVLVIDNAPWHRGQPIDEALRDNPHLEFKRLPSYSPQLNPIERFWKKLRRRATHNRLFDTLADLKAFAPGQPQLLPDRAAQGQKHHRRTTQAEDRQMRQHHRVHVSGRPPFKPVSPTGCSACA